jgi:hypothetical protein
MSCCNAAMPMPYRVPQPLTHVRVLSGAGASVPHAQGAVVAVDAAIANEWISLGWAERV